MDTVNLSLFPKDAEQLMAELQKGGMVIARSKNDFLYILDFNGEYHLFHHTPGAPSGGQKILTKDDKSAAIIRNLAKIADSLYLAEFDKALNIYGVMRSAEEGVLSLFPGDDRSMDEDIQFETPTGKK